ncbi:FAD-binding oxidoreductase [Noviherbaspirillum cavernae]|uniref:FAD-binding oxidoreductase n=1 Tax=Noviherbaspirillum cavernae TaxID=2320862 RepID=A0A418X2U2_9BURK|nr:FAD-binding oxidoreductase [Noviherbaspirillum cavernae]RJG06782.1 FAD-binding oxidoreductase [Noviherbaspirillum cavernae]
MTGMKNEVIDDFKSTLRGQMFQPNDSGYEDARQIWNAMIDRRPAMIVRCAGAADVMRCVAFARDHDVPLAVRGGGHNIAGNAVCDGGLVIDVSAMKAVCVDPEERRAHVEGGATLADFDHEAQAYGLATPLGINSTTGVAGLTLGGGFGWLSRKYGLTVDNLISAEIITADAKRLCVSATAHPDLFWAIRGGGGNFGVVTRFEFQLHPVGPEIFSGLIVYPFEQARQVLTQYQAFVNQMPDDLSVWAVLRQAPPLPFLPAEVHGRNVVVLPIFSTMGMEDARRAVEPLRSFGQPYGEHMGATPYAAWQQAFDPLLTAGARNYWKSHNFASLNEGAIDTVIEYAGKLPDPQCDIFLGLIGGEANRAAPDATAYPHRNVLYAMNVHARWTEPSKDSACIAWAREFFAAAAPHAAGSVYINFMTQDEGERIGEAYGRNFERLMRVKNEYDPQNLFRQNQNIKPSVRAA